MKLDIQKFAVTKSTKFTESNISVANNTSSLKIAIEFSANNTSTYFSSETLTCTCNGVTKSKKVAHPKGGKVSTSFTFDNIVHNSDGSKSVSWSWSCATGTTVLGTVSASGTRTLTQIPRASTPTFSPSPGIIGYGIHINTNRASDTFTHTLEYSIGSVSNTIATDVGATALWVPLATLARQITNSKTGICTITCTTYNGSTLIGTKSVPLTLEVPSTYVPSISINSVEEYDTTMISKNWGVFVQKKSKLKITMSASGIQYSTINGIVVSINGVSYNSIYDDDNNVWVCNTDYIQASGSLTITATATDSRGYSADDTETISLVAYSNPNIQIAQAQRCLSDGTLKDNGTYLLIDYKASISSVDNNNSKIHRIGYKKTTDLNYTYVDLSNNYNVDIQDQVSSFTISSDYAYDIIFEATDSFMTSSIERLIDTGFDLLNFNASGKAMAIGKVSEASANEELLEVGLPTKFLEDIETQDISGISGAFDTLSVDNKSILPDFYSTAETLTGIIWDIDGKPVYRKIIHIDNNLPGLDTIATIDITSLNIDTCIKLDGWTQSARFGRIPLNFYNNGVYNFLHLNYYTEIKYKYSFDADEIYIVIEYTKASS